ncbi:MAG: DNA/RNA nuclease SfsA [Deltaproteobacteria bacterium]|nr:DNA/RNA nuclease SfsA [Deltaproteobacteria bacterium]
MKLPSPLHSGTLVKRYKRFLADVCLDDGNVVTAHCPNSGSMRGCNLPGSPVLLSVADNIKRKYKHTWELVQVSGFWVGINTGYPNKLVKEAIENGVIKELQGYETILSEVPYGTNSRVDLLLKGKAGLCYVEVKNVTLVENDMALFPDAVTTRGQKHLRELAQMVTEGHRAVIFFVVQRPDGSGVAPADAIDPTYGRLLRQVSRHGVEPLAYRAVVSPQEIYLSHSLPVRP